MHKQKSIATTLLLFAFIYFFPAYADQPSNYYLQAGTFLEKPHADKLAKRLTQLLNRPATIKSLQQKDKTYYVVELDSLKDKKHAERFKTILAKSDIPTQVRHHLAPKPKTKKTTTVKPTKTLKKVDKEKHLWNLREADIRSVIDEISRETGKNFLIDPRVQGKVSIISSTPLSSDEVYQVFLSILQVSGYSAIPSGKIIKVVPNIESKALASRVGNRHNPGRGDQTIVRVIPIKYVSAQQLVPILRPLMPQWSHISAYMPSNTVILSGRADNLNRLVEIIHRVDLSSPTQIEMVSLKNALAQDVVKTLKELNSSQRQFGTRPISIAADDRSNAVLISGARNDRLRIRVLITELDTPSPSGLSGHTQVVYLKYLQAEDVVPILAGVARSQFHGDVGTIIGTRTVDQATKLEKPDSQDYQPAQTSNPETVPGQAKTSALKADSSSKPRVEIIAEPNTNSVILNAPLSVMRTLKSVIAQIDFRPAQVLVEALIVEIDEKNINQLGVDWGSVFTERSVNDNNISASSIFRPGFGIIDSTGFSTFEAQITALATISKANILSTPSVVVLDNHLAHLKVGKQVSIIESNFPNNAGGTTTATPYNTFSRKDVALVLNVTPQITHNNGIKLTIAQQNDTLQNPEDLTQTPVFNISEIKTSVLVENGDVLVLGGLIQNELSDTDRRIPIVGDIPGVGRLFQNRNHNRIKKKLLVFLRPVILKSQRDNLRVTGEKYHDMRLDQLKAMRQRPFRQENSEVVMPKLQAKLNIPKPFTRSPRSRPRYR